MAKTLNIFDSVTSNEVAAYWEVLRDTEAPYLGEELFPNKKQLGMKLEWINGKSGANLALRPSAFDADVIPRGRKGFDKLIQDMAFFKESKYIDEELRQQLNMVNQSANDTMRDIILNRIFDDAAELVSAAAVRREIMRMQLLTTGQISINGNDQAYSIDYGLPANHKPTVTTSWSDADNSTPLTDIDNLLDQVASDTGERPRRAILNTATLNNLRKNNAIKSVLLASGLPPESRASRISVIDYIYDELGIELLVYDKVYADGTGTKKFIPDNIFTVIPETYLGNTYFGTTPEESDLIGHSSVADVAVVDTGVAIATSRKFDPVNVETKVSMLTLPSFEMSNMVGILTTVKGA